MKETDQARVWNVFQKLCEDKKMLHEIPEPINKPGLAIRDEYGSVHPRERAHYAHRGALSQLIWKEFWVWEIDWED